MAKDTKKEKKVKVENKLEGAENTAEDTNEEEETEVAAPAKPSASEEGKFHIRAVKGGYVIINPNGQIISQTMPQAEAEDKVLRYKGGK